MVKIAVSVQARMEHTSAFEILLGARFLGANNGVSKSGYPMPHKALKVGYIHYLVFGL